MGILHLDIHLRIAGLVKKKKQVEPTKGRLEQRTRETELSGGILPAPFTSGARRWRRGPSAARVSTPGVPATTGSPREGERKLSAPAGVECGQEKQPARAKERLQFPAPRPAGCGGRRRMREARPPIPPAKEGGPRRPGGCEPRRDPSAHRGAAAAGVSRAAEAAVESLERPAPGAPSLAGTRGHSRLGPEKGPAPAAPHLRRGMREFRPGWRAGCGSRTKAGRRGRSWGRRAGGRCRSPGLWRASGVCNFLCNFCKKEDKNSASCCRALDRLRFRE